MKKKFIWIIVGVIAAFVVVVGGYASYVALQYSRIENELPLEVYRQSNKKTIQIGEEYSISTYNIGFGAYSPDFDFFMDEGIMKTGEKVKGHRGTAISKDHVLQDVNGAYQFIKNVNPDFMFFQEVDTNSTRSYHVNEWELGNDYFDTYDYTFASNFHSAFLLYPFNDPHGKVNSGIVTYSRYFIHNATRYSFTVSKGFDKFFDLDRCFSMSTIDIQNGKLLFLVNLHMSAYDKGGVIRKKQMEELSAFLTQMKEQGHYIVVGGDFNHDLLTYNPDYNYTEDALPFKEETEQLKPDWLSFFFHQDGSSLLPEGFKVVASDNTSTCRAAEMPWKKGINYVTVVDGFIVSDNIEVVEHKNLVTSSEEIEGYAFSDHQPAFMKFKLLEDTNRTL